MYQTMIVPLDGSPWSEAALPVAAKLARACGAALEVVRMHRTKRPDLDQNPSWGEAFRQEERNYLTSLAAQYEPTVGRPVATALLEVPVVASLCEYASSRHAPLIVMTVHGRTGFRRALLGSVSDGLVRHSPAPVLVLRQRRSDGRELTWKRADGPFRSIMVPLDGTAFAEGGLAHAIAIARLTGARLHLVRVVVPVMAGAMVGAFAMHPFPALEESTVTGNDLASEYLAGVADRANAGGGLLAITTEVALSDQPGSAIAESSRRHGADLVVMATHGRGGSRLILGAVADRVLRKGPDAILFVRPTDVSLPAGLRLSESTSAVNTM
jgi:nucleotide-binding universal stress UspA family protein